MIWILLLGLILYLLITRWVAGTTRTPVWVLWLAAMLPMLGLLIWAIAFRGQSMPAQLAIVLLIGGVGLYLYLVQRGRVARSTTEPQQLPSKAPPELQPTVPNLRPIDKAEETSLLTCFPWTVYYLRHIEYHPQSIVCRGQLRTRPEVAYQTVREKVQSQFGDRFHVIFQEYHEGQPFFELMINSAANDSKTLIRPGLAAVLAVLTLVTTSLAALQTAGQVISVSTMLETGLPYSVAIVAFFALRSFGQFITARKYRIATTLPYFIPMILPFFPIGTIGAFTRLRSPIPDRKALFDIGLVGAFLGLSVSIPLLAWGLTQSSVVALPSRGGLFQFQALDPRYSIVLAIFAKLAIGKALTAEAAIRLHPVAIAGWIGLMFTGFNLMPIGQLDGGRMVHAVFGRRMGRVIGQVSKFLLLGFAIAQLHLMLWAVLLFLLPSINEPTLNDVVEVDSFRDIVGLMALVILILLVMPVPKFLSIALGI